MSIGVCQAAGVIGSFFTAPAIRGWYANLVKPSFTPPGWLFAPVWLVLYTLMGVALYLVWQKGLSNPEVRFAVIFFLIHLVFNATWSIVFFGQQNILLALINIIIIWLMIVGLIVLFSRIEVKAAYLLIPYLCWVSFATILNYSIFRLNI